MIRARTCLLAAACGLLLSGAALAAAPFTLASAAFADHAPVPVRYTCNGAGVSPPLAWRGAPDGTRSFALVVTDPDAPDPAHPTHTFVHWVVTFLPARVSALPAGAGGSLPAGGREGRNGAGRGGYVPLCPPIGRHRYFFRLYALDTVLDLPAATGRAALLRAMHGHVLGKAVLVGTYAHHG